MRTTPLRLGTTLNAMTCTLQQISAHVVAWVQHVTFTNLTATENGPQQGTPTNIPSILKAEEQSRQQQPSCDAQLKVRRLLANGNNQCRAQSCTVLQRPIKRMQWASCADHRTMMAANVSHKVRYSKCVIR